MKIAHVINTLSGGGAERVAIEVFKCLKDYGENEFIVGKDVIKLPIDFKPTVIMPFEKKPFYMPSFIYEKILIEKLEEKLKDFEVVISHLRDMNVRLCMLKSEGKLNCKLIVVEHVTTYSYSKKEINLIKKFYRYADVSVAVSEKVAQNLSDYEAKNIQIIENFVDVEDLERKALEEKVNLEGFSFLAAGRLSDDKGFDTLIKAFKIANIKDSKLFILGEGSKKRELMNLVEKLDLKGKVEFLGFKKNPFPYIKACDVFVTSSRREAFPMATLEAMALKKTVISTNVVPFATDGYNSLVVPVDNVEALAKSMVKIYKDKNLRETLSENAYQTAKKYDRQRFCQNYRNLISSI
ncbi:glycosyltransferase [Sulfurihydrogenibium sp.]|uniref:glycosyltransferase n=1 Tax=Sulfurihydrogenibium sp. TaxID=2053621 RepID=UPI003D116AFD